MIRVGLDRLLRDPRPLAGRRYGLLGHAASLSAELIPAHLALAAAAPPAVLFGPEHGFYGIEQDMAPSDHGEDPWTGLRVVSLYGRSEESLRPEAAVFARLDLLVIDLQDVGARYYTYAASAVWATEAALAAGCQVWVLDRPNPLGGMEIEGNLRQPGFASFVGALEVPVRHGLTLGELVLLEARRRRWSGDLEVWPMEGWERGMSWEETGRPWVPPSPNLPTLEAAIAYPGTCLVEGTELSEGRGTTSPFQLVGGPGVDPVGLARELAGRGLAGVGFVPTYFRPQYQKHRGVVCGGVRVIATDRRSFRPYRCGVEILAAIRRIAPEALAWREAPYEFVTDRPAIDLLSGDDRLRAAVEGDGDPAGWIATWPEDEAAFRRERREILLYPETSAR